MVEVLGLRPGDRFADLGCGVGTLTAHLTEVTGASGLGFDFAPSAIAWARARYAADPRLTFRVADLDEFELEPATFDAVVAIDTLSFATDRERCVRRAMGALVPGGRLVAWYSCYHAEDEAASRVEAAETPVGRALQGLGVRWTAEDFTAGELALWRRSAEALVALEGAFAGEGRQREWRDRQRETASVLPRLEAGRGRRWLYVATAR
jgi:SAM-dependent methyltransferase